MLKTCYSSYRTIGSTLKLNILLLNWTSRCQFPLLSVNANVEELYYYLKTKSYVILWIAHLLVNMCINMCLCIIKGREAIKLYIYIYNFLAYIYMHSKGVMLYLMSSRSQVSVFWYGLRNVTCANFTGCMSFQVCPLSFSGGEKKIQV